jgi:hypothetical protein
LQQRHEPIASLFHCGSHAGALRLLLFELHAWLRASLYGIEKLCHSVATGLISKTMTFDKIREAVEKRPFRPFTLHLNDGHSAVVDHPELIILPPDTEDAVVIYEVPGGVRIIDVDSVTEISMGVVRRNGKAKPKRKRR